MLSTPTTEAQQGCQHGFARDENPLLTTYALDCTTTESSGHSIEMSATRIMKWVCVGHQFIEVFIPIDTANSERRLKSIFPPHTSFKPFQKSSSRGIGFERVCALCYALQRFATLCYDHAVQIKQPKCSESRPS